MKLHYKKSGKGKSLVILHGLLGSSANWHTLARRFSTDYEVYTPDLRNHGESQHAGIMDYDSIVGDLMEFYHDHAISSSFLIGHSMGGKAAMEFSLLNPGKVEKLVIVDIAPRKYPVQHEKYIQSLEKLDMETFNRREEIDTALSAEITNPAIRQFLLKNLKREASGKFAWRVNLGVIHSALEPIGREIMHKNPFNHPALFIAGGKSDYITADDEKNIKSLFPLSRIIYFEECGHWVHAEAPDRFYNSVIQFLNDH